MKRKNYKLQAAAIITGTVLAISTGIAAWAAETEQVRLPSSRLRQKKWESLR